MCCCLCCLFSKIFVVANFLLPSVNVIVHVSDIIFHLSHFVTHCCNVRFCGYCTVFCVNGLLH
ncbi:hypothetical protein D0812_22165 [Vibrio owensii]|uniref:DUF3265 domain-containing protein n=1 Tax=Vibrio owensii TaxID=696485 RepID=A0ABM6ZMY4_9VIBR|nr:hypothetical protein D0812_22165 [Vibrio owensii]